MKAMAVDCVPLNVLHRRTIAVRLVLAGREQLVFGRGIYERDRELGQVLRIKLPADDDGEILLAEDDWNGEIMPGESVGCDFLVRLN